MFSMHTLAYVNSSNFTTVISSESDVDDGSTATAMATMTPLTWIPLPKPIPICYFWIGLNRPQPTLTLPLFVCFCIIPFDTHIGKINNARKAWNSEWRACNVWVCMRASMCTFTRLQYFRNLRYFTKNYLFYDNNKHSFICFRIRMHIHVIVHFTNIKWLADSQQPHRWLQFGVCVYLCKRICLNPFSVCYNEHYYIHHRMTYKQQF